MSHPYKYDQSNDYEDLENFIRRVDRNTLNLKEYIEKLELRVTELEAELIDVRNSVSQRPGKKTKEPQR